jgi:hypothetical protein
MKGSLRGYYLTRGLLVLGWMLLMWMLEAKREIILAGSVLMLFLFLWLPHTGRYLVDVSKPFLPLRRDERERAISLRAASYAFATLATLLAVAVLCAGLRAQDSLSLDTVSAILAVGMIVWFVGSLWLRRRM